MACRDAAGVNALLVTLHFVQVLLASGLCQRRLKSSDILVKGPYNTESLSDALRDTYKVLIESDDSLSSYSYQNSRHFYSVAIASRTPAQKKLWLFNTASFKEDDAGCATVYFNATEKNWVTSSDFALFASWKRMEISVKWSGEMLLPVVIGLFAWSNMLSTVASIIRNGGDGGRKEFTSDLFVIVGAILGAISCCAHIVMVVLIVKTRNRAVPTIEIQLAMVLRKFAKDVAKEFANNGKKSIAGPGDERKRKIRKCLNS
ncbi:hypothetical protein V1515DRAFT_614521 [Lipomyces mesembrius]